MSRVPRFVLVSAGRLLRMWRAFRGVKVGTSAAESTMGGAPPPLLRRRRGLADAAAAPAFILLYHRVARPEVDPWSLSVSPERFADQMQALSRVAHPIALRELVHHVKEGTVRKGSVAVTFDDGYADNALIAAPVLARFGIPATIFVASGSVGDRQPFWWEELGEILLVRTPLPRRLRLEVAGKINEWELGDCAQANRQQLRSFSSWKATDPPATERHRAFQQLSAEFRRLAANERNHAMEQLRHWCGRELDGPDARPLSAAEIHRLQSTGSIEIGAHTRTHAWLAAMPLERQALEISEGKAMLEDITGAPVVSFAYPYGGPRDFTPETTAVVREAGFESGCTSIAGIVRSGADPFQLRRMHPLDWDGGELAARLAWWTSSLE